ncbi:MAG TPA: zf-HC2 domain-containing protein [Anaeromyxobacter sp.]|nr:zf-HC2 domain-containing protein [Anaeromyxobacter sp.]
MTTTQGPCRENELALSLRAAGALDGDDAARLEAHLVLCPACRAEADAVQAALGLAKLPPVSESERRVFDGLADRTRTALRRSSRVRWMAKRAAAAVLTAAAAAAIVLAPAVLRRDARAPAGAQETWQPDLDTLWSDASVVDLDGSTTTDGTSAAYADGAGLDADDADAPLTALDQ